MAAATRTKTPWLVAAAVVLALGAGVGVGAAVTGSDDSSASDTPAGQQVAGWRQACQQWSDSYDSDDAPGPGSGWCHDMTDWMYDQMRDGTMSPMMMWGNPQRMGDTCRQWMNTNPDSTSSADASIWCDQMVTWMTDHMGNWSDWNDDDWDGWMHGPMMGR